MNKQEIARQRAKDWYKNNKERKQAYDLNYNKKNREVKNAKSVVWNARNKDKKSQISKKYYYANKNKVFANCAARRARVLNAMPKWLTQEHKKQIIEIYKNRPEGYHVDHIMPLKGKNSCGLHVPWNLQYLPATENFKKGNKV